LAGEAGLLLADEDHGFGWLRSKITN
jgi:hypothetical protein